MYNLFPTHVPGEGLGDAPFTNALRTTLVVRTPVPLNSSVVAFFCRSVMTVGDTDIEMCSLFSIGMRLQSSRGQEAALNCQRHIYCKEQQECTSNQYSLTHRGLWPQPIADGVSKNEIDGQSTTVMLDLYNRKISRSGS